MPCTSTILARSASETTTRSQSNSRPILREIRFPPAQIAALASCATGRRVAEGSPEHLVSVLFRRPRREPPRKFSRNTGRDRLDHGIWSRTVEERKRVPLHSGLLVLHP